uniref:Phospholipase B-like n=1 Tax=Aureoumbra lagunensis TaxID=44058 RepID=A0A7S3K4T8_9STRA|mmetsp:Transcript_2246/g.3545  ORF Transcript_2246/g.3545 Transcript_2246/m.3545 type:complete len:649 (+) Transcript_2246:54-2000(+)
MHESSKNCAYGDNNQKTTTVSTKKCVKSRILQNIFWCLLVLIIGIIAALHWLHSVYRQEFKNTLKQQEWFVAVWTSNNHWTVVAERGQKLDTNEIICAAARYTKAAEHRSGFGELTLETRGENLCSEKQNAQAVGFLEGILTAREIADAAKNLVCEIACNGTMPKPLKDFFNTHEAWLEIYQQAILNETDAIHRYAILVLEQYRGLQLGYQAALGLSTANVLNDLRRINYLGDLFDIIPAAERGFREDFADESGVTASKNLEKHGHCTALVKLTANNQLIFGHASWFHYSNMVRIYKHYHFSFMHVKNQRSSFSSYPGMLSSLDDFYLMHDTKLVILQTTNGIYNTSLFDAVTPFALPAWIRVRTANALAESGKDWAQILGIKNSGTYNNQYDIIDLKLKNSNSSGLLTIVEQIPGLVQSIDRTEHLLEESYFLSYNVPHIPKIYQLSGYSTLDQKRGRPEGSEYSQAPRAQIARRDQHTIKSIEDAKTFLRSNHYGQGDPLAPNPWDAICSRGDLVRSETEQQPTLAGCYDAKISSDSLFQEHGAAFIINGPTNQHQPTFSWDNIINAPGPIHHNISTWKDVTNMIIRDDHTTVPIQGSASHQGQSITFDFRFERVSPPRVWFQSSSAKAMRRQEVRKLRAASFSHK